MPSKQSKINQIEFTINHRELSALFNLYYLKIRFCVFFVIN